MNNPDQRWIMHDPTRPTLTLRSQRQGCGPWSCSELPRVGNNEGFVVRSAGRLGRRLKGKRCRYYEL